jgi:two-component system sensor histidine kinase KdpD
VTASPRSRRRLLAGLLLGLGLVAVIVAVMLPVRDSVTVATPALALILPGIVAGFVAGRVIGAVTAAVAAVVLDVVFIEPYGTLDVHVTDDLVALLTFTAVAVSVAALVELATDRRRAAEQRAIEILALSEEKERFRREQERLSIEKQALEQIEEARRALLRSVSHDLRTPLATIRAITSDLRAGTPYDAPTREELLDLVGDEAERLDRLVANLLSMSRIEAGALRPEIQAIAVDELVTARTQRLARVLRDVQVTTDIPADLPLVDADYVLLDQVLTNLIDNATRHAPPGSTIHIEAHRVARTGTSPQANGTGGANGAEGAGGIEGTSRAGGAAPVGAAGRRERADGMVEVAVIDQGPGIPASLRRTVFEPFERASDSRSSGLGLAICKAIVEAHGGTIAVADGPGGRGTRVSFTVPVHHARIEAS